MKRLHLKIEDEDEIDDDDEDDLVAATPPKSDMQTRTTITSNIPSTHGV